jgi:ribosomal protein S1
MKLLGILKNILFEGEIGNPIIDVTLNDYKIRFILSTHAKERMTRRDNDSDITIDEIKSAIEDAIPKITNKAFVVQKRAIQGPVIDGTLLKKDFSSGQTRRENAQEFFIMKTDSGLQISCKVLNFNKNRGEIEIIIKTLLKSHTNKLNVNNANRNTLHLNIIENLDDFDNYFTITV